MNCSAKTVSVVLAQLFWKTLYSPNRVESVFLETQYSDHPQPFP
jgi:hypothetical protein